MPDIIIAALICTFGPFIGLLLLAFGLPLGTIFIDWVQSELIDWRLQRAIKRAERGE